MTQITWKTEKRKLSDLFPSTYNPRKFSETNKKYLSDSLSKFSLAEPIVINSDNTIIGGHFRFKILTERYGRNGTEIDVRVPNRPLDKSEETELNLRLNRNLGEWDFDLLGKIDTSMLQDVGFDSKEIDRATISLPSEADDEVPVAPQEAISKTGEVYQLGRHRLMCGDATKAEDVSKLMNGQKADMVFTDPPYSVGYGRDNDKLKDTARSFHWSKSRIKNDIKNDNLSVEECSEKIWEPAFKNLYDFSKTDCSFYMTMCQGGDQMMMMMMMMMKENWQVKHELIWVKNSQVFSMGRLDYDYQHEPILFGWKEKHNWYGVGQFKTSVWEIPKPNKSDLHPTMKPIELIANALLNSSKQNDNVLDLFGGSGSTLIACEKTHRICYMMEIDPIYCDVIRKRYEIFTRANC